MKADDIDLTQYRKIILVGSMGSGKSWLAKKAYKEIWCYTI